MGSAASRSGGSDGQAAVTDGSVTARPAVVEAEQDDFEGSDLRGGDRVPIFDPPSANKTEDGKMSCPEDGCAWTGSYEEYAWHWYNDCDAASVPCDRCGDGVKRSCRGDPHYSSTCAATIVRCGDCSLALPRERVATHCCAGEGTSFAPDAESPTESSSVAAAATATAAAAAAIGLAAGSALAMPGLPFYPHTAGPADSKTRPVAGGCSAGAELSASVPAVRPGFISVAHMFIPDGVAAQRPYPPGRSWAVAVPIWLFGFILRVDLYPSGALHSAGYVSVYLTLASAQFSQNQTGPLSGTVNVPLTIDIFIGTDKAPLRSFSLPSLCASTRLGFARALPLSRLRRGEGYSVVVSSPATPQAAPARITLEQPPADDYPVDVARRQQ